MHKDRLSRIRSKLAMATLIVEFILAIMAIACMKNYGAFSMDDQVGHDFRSGNIRPEFECYYSGRDAIPYAIIGIDPIYTVPSEHWTSIEPQPDQLKKMSRNIYGKGSEIQKQSTDGGPHPTSIRS